MDRLALAMGVAFALMWSSAFTSARIIVEQAAPIHALSFRFLVSGIVAVAIARAMGQTWKLTPAQWRATVLFGVCQNALYLGLNWIAMQTVEASLAAIIASTMPLIVALLAWMALGDRLTPLRISGIAVGFLGVALIMGSRIESGADTFGVALCVVGALALSLATLALRGATSGGNYMMVVGLQMLIGSAALMPVAPLVETFRIEPTWSLVIAFSYTIVFPGLLATWVWVALVNRIGAIRSATYHFLNPVFGVAVAAVILAEPLGWLDAIGVLVVTAGILAVQISRNPESS